MQNYLNYVTPISKDKIVEDSAAFSEKLQKEASETATTKRILTNHFQDLTEQDRLDTHSDFIGILLDDITSDEIVQILNLENCLHIQLNYNLFSHKIIKSKGRKWPK